MRRISKLIGVVSAFALLLVVSLSVSPVRAASPSPAMPPDLSCDAASAKDAGACISRMLTDPRSPYSPDHKFTPAELQPVSGPTPKAGVAAVGSWSVVADCTVNDQKVNGIHASLTKSGKVLMTAGSGYNRANFEQKVFKTWLWDPTTPSVCPREIPMPIDKDLFCSGHMHLPDGRILFFGGTGRYGTPPSYPGSPDYYTGIREAYVFDDVFETFTPTGSMNVARWYPNGPANAAGEPIVVGGMDENAVMTSTNEIYSSATGQWTTLPGQRLFPMYAGMTLKKNGYVCYLGTYFVTRVGVNPQCWGWPNNSSTPITGLPSPDCRDQGRSISLVPAQAQKAMVIGGGCSSGVTSSTAIVDLGVANPAFTAGPSLGYTAQHLCSMVLPDWSVFVSGGSDHNTNPRLLARRLPHPYTGAWETLANPTVPRLYHNTCLLTPDGSVVTMGTNSATGVETRFEVYKPWYMQGVIRPNITSIAATPQPDGVYPLRLGGIYKVDYTAYYAVSQATLTKLGSDTHSSDPNQREVQVTVTQAGNRTVNLTIDPSWGVNPLGVYMLTLKDWKGTPSTAKMVRIVPATAAKMQGLDLIQAVQPQDHSAHTHAGH